MPLPEREAEPRNPAPQRFPASTASTVGARCATLIGMYGFIDSLNRLRRIIAPEAVLYGQITGPYTRR